MFHIFQIIFHYEQRLWIILTFPARMQAGETSYSYDHKIIYWLKLILLFILRCFRQSYIDWIVIEVCIGFICWFLFAKLIRFQNFRKSTWTFVCRLSWMTGNRVENMTYGLPPIDISNKLNLNDPDKKTMLMYM